MLNFALTLKTSLDCLDAAVMKHLPGFAPGWVDFTREQSTLGSVVYKLHQQDLGDLGEIRLRKLGKSLAELQIELPPYPRMGSLTQEQRSELESLPTAEAQRSRLREMLQELQERDAELYRRRVEHHKKVIQVLFEGLARERLQTATKKAGPQGGTMERVKEARMLVKQGEFKTKACKRAGIDVRTYDRYVDQIIDWSD